ncbi:F-box and WD-40 domain protein 10 [Fasciola hepatica]|uniref:F-box and WD-40 domain protein 10 n=1 Tax=Fasciola hepatica TaxID=6192 RepID=A0A4E0RUJ7_FASHE|nr:F-box and WD-40 domain protein 10 [Fasciola hepatica]
MAATSVQENKISIVDQSTQLSLTEMTQFGEEVVKILDVLSLKHFIEDIIEKFCDIETVKDLEFIFRAMGSKENVYASTRLYSSQNVDGVSGPGRDVHLFLSVEDMMQFLDEWLSSAPKLYRKLFLLQVLQRVPESMHLSIWEFLQLSIRTSSNNRSSNKKETKSPSINELLRRLPLDIGAKISQMARVAPKEKLFNKSSMETAEAPNIQEQSVAAYKQAQKVRCFIPKENFARYFLVPVPRTSSCLGRVLSVDDAKKSGRLSAHETQYKIIGNNGLKTYENLATCSWSLLAASMRKAYANILLERVIVEERNVYCGTYNTLVLLERSRYQKPAKRRITHAGSWNQTWLAHCDGSAEQRKIKFLDISCATKSTERSSATDFLIRPKLSPTRRLGKYTLRFVTGGADCLCCVWRLDSREPIWCIPHARPVTAVVMQGYLCVSGDRGGEIKVWRLTGSRPQLIKVLCKHTGPITVLRMDSIHLVSGSADGYVCIWSLSGDFSECLGVLPHPNQVLCLELQYLRVITGCADGRVRVWNLLSQRCQRVILGNNRREPILGLFAMEDRLILISATNIISMNFNPGEWHYELDQAFQAEHLRAHVPMTNASINHWAKPRSRAESRWFRARMTQSADSRILDRAIRSQSETSLSRHAIHKASDDSTRSHRSSRTTGRSERTSSSRNSSSSSKSSSRKLGRVQSTFIHPETGRRMFLISPPIPGSYTVRQSKHPSPKSARLPGEKYKDKAEKENSDSERRANRMKATHDTNMSVQRQQHIFNAPKFPNTSNKMGLISSPIRRWSEQFNKNKRHIPQSFQDSLNELKLHQLIELNRQNSDVQPPDTMRHSYLSSTRLASSTEMETNTAITDLSKINRRFSEPELK